MQVGIRDKRARAKPVARYENANLHLFYGSSHHKEKAPAVKKVVAAPAASAPTEAARTELPEVLSNVALVNKIVGICGGPDQARQTAEAIRTCGGVDLFLQYLKLVAGIRTSEQAT